MNQSMALFLANRFCKVAVTHEMASDRVVQFSCIAHRSAFHRHIEAFDPSQGHMVSLIGTCITF